MLLRNKLTNSKLGFVKNLLGLFLATMVSIISKVELTQSFDLGGLV